MRKGLPKKKKLKISQQQNVLLAPDYIRNCKYSCNVSSNLSIAKGANVLANWEKLGETQTTAPSFEETL